MSDRHIPLAVLTQGGPCATALLKELSRRGVKPPPVWFEPPPWDEKSWNSPSPILAEHQRELAESWISQGTAKDVAPVGRGNSLDMEGWFMRNRPEWLLLAGASLLSERMLSIPLKGTLNAHPGLLPWVRGVNVVEHAVLRGVAVGVTVHMVSPGIDEGDIVSRRLLAMRAEDTLGAVRVRIDEASARDLAEAAASLLSGDPLKATPQEQRFPYCNRLDDNALRGVEERVARGEAVELYKQWKVRFNGDQLPPTAKAPAQLPLLEAGPSMAGLPVAFQNKTPLNRWFVEFLRRATGRPFRFARSGEPPAVLFDASRGGEAPICVSGGVPFGRAQAREGMERLIRKPTGAWNEGLIPIDLKRMAAFWAGDEGYDVSRDEDRDEFGRLMGAASLPHQWGDVAFPVVNAAMNRFSQTVAERLPDAGDPMGPIPPGVSCALLLTHDLDAPVYPIDLPHFEWLFSEAVRAGEIGFADEVFPYVEKGRREDQKKLGKSVLLRLLCEIRRRTHLLKVGKAFCEDSIRAMTASEMVRGVRKVWACHALSELLRSRNVGATVFAASNNRYRVGGYGHQDYDVGYGLNDPRWESVLRQWKDDGVDLGLHASFLAREDWKRFEAEIQTLEAWLGAPVVSNRHHVWHMRREWWKTLCDQNKGGLLVDCSLSFNDVVGYRVGMGLPFTPPQAVDEPSMRLLEIPTLGMDGAIMDEGGHRPAVAAKRFVRHLDVMKRFGVVAAIDWHVHAVDFHSEIFRPFAESFKRILDMAVGDPDIWVGSVRDYMNIFLDCQARLGRRAPIGEER